MSEIEYKGARYSLENGKWIGESIQDLRVRLTLNESQLDKIAEAIQSRIQENLFRSKDYMGRPVEPNRPLTVKKKGHGKVFFDTGELYRSILIRKPGNREREVLVAEKRSQIAYWLQYGTKKMVARTFFGITPEAMAETKNILLKNIK